MAPTPEKKKPAKRVFTPGSQPREPTPLSEYSDDRSEKSDPEYSHSEAEDDPGIPTGSATPKTSTKAAASIANTLDKYFSRTKGGATVVDAEALAKALKKTLEEDGVNDDDDDDPEEEEEDQGQTSQATPSKRRKLVPSAKDSRKRSRKASCWKWFRDSEIDLWYSVCQVPDPVTAVICGKRISCGPKSTTTGMNKHLKRHKKVLAEFLRLKAEQEVQNAIDTLDVNEANKMYAEAKDQARAMLGKEPNSKKGPVTRSIKAYFKTQTHLTPYGSQSAAQKRIDLDIMIMLARLSLPFSTVDHIAFKSFVQSLRPQARVKSSSTFRKRICPRLYDNIKSVVDEVLTKELRAVDTVALTADHWTSRSYDSYQSMTIHYINEDFQLMKFTQECRRFYGEHSAENISKVLSDQVNHIVGKNESLRITATTDSASNMVKSVADTENIDEHIRCIAHILNNACEAGFKGGMKNAVNRCKALAADTHKSSKTCDLIRDHCNLVGIGYVKIIQPVKTRWHSVYMTMTSVVRLKKALLNLKSNADRDNRHAEKLIKHIPTKAQFESMEALLPYLKMIKDFSDRLTSETFPTIHLVIPVLMALNTSPALTGNAGDFQTSFLAYLNSRATNWGQDDINWCLGAFLHPRYKGAVLISPNSDHYFEDAKACIVARVSRRLELEKGPDPQGAQAAQAPPPPPPPVDAGLDDAMDESQWSAVDKYLDESSILALNDPAPAAPPDESIVLQIEIYLNKLPRMAKRDGDVLAYWKSQEDLVPDLARFARAVLCIPASSASSERLFSLAGRTITTQRTGISSARAEQLIYVNQNFDKIADKIETWNLGLVEPPFTPKQTPVKGISTAKSSEPAGSSQPSSQTSSQPSDPAAGLPPSTPGTSRAASRTALSHDDIRHLLELEEEGETHDPDDEEWNVSDVDIESGDDLEIEEEGDENN